MVQKLKLHDTVWATVEEPLPHNEVIISLGGDLLRVANLTERQLRAGQKIRLMVKSVAPVRFQLVDPLLASSSVSLRI